MSYDNEALEKAYTRVLRLLVDVESERDYWMRIAWTSGVLNLVFFVVFLLEVF